MPKRTQPGLYPTKAVRVTAETRRYQMLELTKAGRTEKEIAEALGVARSLVNRDVRRVLGELARSATRTADAVRALQMERYLALLSRWWLPAMQGDAEATRMVLSIMARIDTINGIIPDKALIDMRTQTIQVGDEVLNVRITSGELGEALDTLRDVGVVRVEPPELNGASVDSLHPEEPSS